MGMEIGVRCQVSGVRSRCLKPDTRHLTPFLPASNIREHATIAYQRGFILRACIQRVTEAHVTVGGAETGRIGRGLVVLLGIGHDDGEPRSQPGSPRKSSACVYSKTRPAR